MNILICVDDKLTIDLMTGILEQEGHTVTLVNDMETILATLRATLREKHPDLIFIDLQIQKVGGEYMIRILKEDPHTRHIRVILFSGYSDLKDVAQKCGADGYLATHFNLKELRKLLNASR